MPTTFKTDLKNLFFDPQNPRLIGDFNNNQEKIFRYLIDDIGVDDLLESFAASGIFNADPIIVREKEDGKTFDLSLAASGLLVRPGVARRVFCNCKQIR